MAIPARLTVLELAEALGCDLTEVVAVLQARDEPSAEDDVVGPEVSNAVATTLGKQVAVEARDLALEVLYGLEATRDDPTPGLPDKARRLVDGVLKGREALDHEIEEASEHWSVARMPAIDRTILRIGLYELKHEPQTPAAVIVAEAVRMAKTYSTERSGAFVNGVLATLAKKVRD